MKYLPMVMLHALFLASLLAISHSLLKWVATQNQTTNLELILSNWRTIFVALSIYGFIFFYYIIILRNTSLSLIYPVYTGLSVLFVLGSGRFIFGEHLALSQQFGAMFIAVGVVLISS